MFRSRKMHYEVISDALVAGFQDESIEGRYLWRLTVSHQSEFMNRIGHFEFTKSEALGLVTYDFFKLAAVLAVNKWEREFTALEDS
ncbi:MAG: hypothetical protein JSS95_01350 [Acidobacteria bacterium]|nr:hypothetical protein [Acidobacteriota bacterium]